MPGEPIDGLPATRAALQGLLDRVSDLRWDVRHVAEAPDGTVLYEKTEHYLIGETWVALPCMIALEFTDDLISHWRAYFDVATWTRQQPTPGDRLTRHPVARATDIRTKTDRAAILAGVRICFVCLGNICRSPAAAAVFTHLAAADGRRGDGRLGRHQPLPPRRGTPRAHRGGSRPAGHRDRPPGPPVHRRRLRPLRPRRGHGRRQPPGPPAPGPGRRRPGQGRHAAVVRRWRRPPATSTSPTRGAARRRPTPRCTTCSMRPAAASSSTSAPDRDRRLPADLVDGLGVTARDPVSGGDIAQAFRLDTADGPLFAKTHPAPMPGLFEREAAGLRALRRAGAIAVPEVVRERPSGLVLEWIDVGGRDGAQRARPRDAAGRPPPGDRPALRRPRRQPGRLPRSQPVDLTPTDDWAEFFLERRVRPLTGAGRRAGPDRSRRAGRRRADRPHAAERCRAARAAVAAPRRPVGRQPPGRPAGRQLADRPGRVLRPPRGGPGDDAAVRRLRRRRVRGLRRGVPAGRRLARSRRWYQLPPLLVHAILFGGSYGRAAMARARQLELTTTTDTRIDSTITADRRGVRGPLRQVARYGGASTTHPAIAPPMIPPMWPPIEMPGMVNVSSRLSSSTVPRPVENGLTPGCAGR